MNPRVSSRLEVALAVLIAFAVAGAMIVALLMIDGCHASTSMPVQNRPDFDADAHAPPDGPSDDCATSCAAWRALACPEANPTPSDVPCEVVCRNAEQSGLDEAKDVQCAGHATSCAALRGCPY